MKIISQTNSTYELKDLSVASYLFASHQVTFLGTRKLPNGDVLFQFSPKELAEKLVNLYWNLQAPPIQPKQLFSAQRDLKDLIFGT